MLARIYVFVYQVLIADVAQEDRPIIQKLDCACLLLRPYHPSACYKQLDDTSNPKRDLRPPRIFRNEAPSNSTNKYSYKRQNSSIPLDVLLQRSQESRISRYIMQHARQHHRRDFRQS